MKSLFLKKRSPLEQKLGYTFKDKKRLDAALLHRSYRFEQGDIDYDNERLEFLGDSVLGLAAGLYLFNKYVDQNEGDLTRGRSRLTNTRILAEVASGLGLGEYLKLGKGELATGGKERVSNLANAMEAVLGAVFLDGGLVAVEKVFIKHFVPLQNIEARDDWVDNPKGHLQMIAQRRWHINPVYCITSEHGKPHEKTYEVEVFVGDKYLGCGSGLNKRAAEEQAAVVAIESMSKKHNNLEEK